MQINVESLDRIVRIVAGLVLPSLPLWLDSPSVILLSISALLLFLIRESILRITASLSLPILKSFLFSVRSHSMKRDMALGYRLPS